MKTKSAPSNVAIFFGSAFLVHAIAGLFCWAVGWNYTDLAQIIVAIIGLGLAFFLI